MKKYIIKLLFFLFLTPMIGMAQECYDFDSCVPQKIKDLCIEETVNGCIDWTNGVIYTVGSGVPNEKFTSESQRKYSALRAAEIVAQRNLLQIISGVRLNSESTVETGVLTSETIRSRVSGTLRNAQTFGPPYYAADGTATVTVRYFMNSLNRMLNIRTQKSSNSNSKSSNSGSLSSSESEQASANNNSGQNSGVYSGLVLDASEFNLAPALSPKILDEDGKEIYGSAYVERDFSLKYGIVGYAKDVEKAKSNDRVSGNPLVIKPVKSSGKNNADLVINKEDAAKLEELYKKQSFLREARVMIVVQ